MCFRSLTRRGLQNQLFAVHMRLALFACGLGTVNVTNLVKLLDATRSELRQLVPAAMPAGA